MSELLFFARKVLSKKNEHEDFKRDEVCLRIKLQALCIVQIKWFKLSRGPRALMVT